MTEPEVHSDQRGGGDRARTDAFRYAPGSAIWAFFAIGGLGAFAIVVVLLDIGNAQSRSEVAWVLPAGLFLILCMLGLLWLTRRAPVLLKIGPDGLDLPAALARPIAWRDIWRIRHSRQKMLLRSVIIMLKVDLAEGVRPAYKRRLWTWPTVDSWIARKWGLRVPVHNLDAAEEVVLASVERFKPVQMVAT
ncbi:MAG: hypothetical protein GTO67_07350 [Gammaproteobacteria bacterium]|nr:hypothetical protein [Gammaproteobacteria bacterium]NIT16211.1 hypothetical protein [Gammaproteobacteria bacterium]